jgi:hypothetical protein
MLRGSCKIARTSGCLTHLVRREQLGAGPARRAGQFPAEGHPLITAQHRGADPDLPVPLPQLPPEVSLMEETGYSRDTVRAAEKVLRESGWVTVTHGLGTFVNPPELRRDGLSS